MANKPACPQCGGELEKVRNSSGSMLNDYQFDAVRAGDWFCETCPPNDRGASNSYCYWWDRELGGEHGGRCGE